MKTIITSLLSPPIPTRAFDWSAHFDGEEESIVGMGSSESMAILDLLNHEIERLEAECFTLSAGVCRYRGGNEHGNPICLKTMQPI